MDIKTEPDDEQLSSEIAYNSDDRQNYAILDEVQPIHDIKVETLVKMEEIEDDNDHHETSRFLTTCTDSIDPLEIAPTTSFQSNLFSTFYIPPEEAALIMRASGVCRFCCETFSSLQSHDVTCRGKLRFDFENRVQLDANDIIEPDDDSVSANIPENSYDSDNHRNNENDFCEEEHPINIKYETSGIHHKSPESRNTISHESASNNSPQSRLRALSDINEQQIIMEILQKKIVAVVQLENAVFSEHNFVCSDCFETFPSSNILNQHVTLYNNLQIVLRSDKNKSAHKHRLNRGSNRSSDPSVENPRTYWKVTDESEERRRVPKGPLTAEQIELKRIKENVRKRAWRASLTEQKKEETRQKTVEATRIRRANMNENDLELSRKNGAEASRRRRKNMTADELELSRKKSVEATRIRRANMNENDLEFARKKAAEASRRRRKNMTADELELSKKKSAEAARIRAKLNESDLELARKISAEGTLKKRENMTADELELSRKKTYKKKEYGGISAEATCKRRVKMNEHEPKNFKVKAVERARMKRANMNEDESQIMA